MDILTFRQITTADVTDDAFNDGSAWSRVYEYPLVLQEMQAHAPDAQSVHNSCWGFAGIHVVFKENIDKQYQAVHSDVRASDLADTFVYDITKPAGAEHKDRYDIVLNISTMEEVNDDHWLCFENLFAQVKPGGLFIATFDLPGLQLKKFETEFNQPMSLAGEALNGKNSIVPNRKRKKLNCGIMTIRRS